MTSSSSRQSAMKRFRSLSFSAIRQNELWKWKFFWKGNFVYAHELNLLFSDESDSIKWNCVSKVDLGKLAPSAQKTVSLSAIPLLKGFHSLPPIIVNERLLNQTYAFRDFYKVPVS